MKIACRKFLGFDILNDNGVLSLMSQLFKMAALKEIKTSELRNSMSCLGCKRFFEEQKNQAKLIMLKHSLNDGAQVASTVLSCCTI